jgi:hypothetical protein
LFAKRIPFNSVKTNQKPLNNVVASRFHKSSKYLYAGVVSVGKLVNISFEQIASVATIVLLLNT